MSVPTTIRDLLITHPTSIPPAHPSQSNPHNPVVFLDISIADNPVGRITIELRADIVPLTAENFRQMCIGYIEPRTRQLLGYKNCNFHRVVRGFMVQGGDVIKRDGTGSISIYGDKFNDENFQLKHDRAGLVSSANSGQHTNGSQFYVTLDKCEWLDGKHVVFGKVIDSMTTVRAIENVMTGLNDQPTQSVIITECGEL